MSEQIKSEQVKEIKSPLEFTFKKKNYQINPRVGYGKKRETGVDIVNYGSVISESRNEMYQSIDFEMIEALLIVRCFTGIKINMEQPPEKLQKLYDELLYDGIVDKVFYTMASEIESIRAIYKRQFDIVVGHTRATFLERREENSFGIYAKRLLESFLGDGDYKAILAESTGMIDGLTRVMSAYRGESKKQQEEDARSEYSNLIDLSVRKDIKLPEKTEE